MNDAEFVIFKTALYFRHAQKYVCGVCKILRNIEIMVELTVLYSLNIMVFLGKVPLCKHPPRFPPPVGGK
jgi:hypothetical protein